MTGKFFDFHPNQIEMGRRDIENVIKAQLKKLSVKGIDNILNENSPDRHYAYSDIIKNIKGRAKSEGLMLLILEVTAAYDGPLVEVES
ncbi:hypothetical protein F9U42_04480 [Pectobacterium versatile]|uniref:hypothetical protein n=1 Tax=Pectobacterium TaxID=122277 RepID=UPI0012B6A800|nr:MULTISPECIES: hypothetical protein [Pectobacterium]MBQ4766389.1 hypothetical protein [Pectobacterium versatile]